MASHNLSRALSGGVLCALAFAAPAAADTWCIAPATGCDHAVPPVLLAPATVSDQKTIQSALDTVASMAHPGPDTIQLGAGTYHIDDDPANVSLSYSFSGYGQATLKGMGPGQTILTRNVLAQPPAAINGGALNVTDLTVHIPPTGLTTLEADTPAIDTKGPLFQNLAIDVLGTSSVGIRIDNPVNETIRNVTFNGPAARIDSSTCIEVNPGAPGSVQTISDITATNCGIDIAHNHASVSIERARINAESGVLAGGGADGVQQIDNSVIHGFLGIQASPPATLVVNQSTLVGDGGGSGLFVNNTSTSTVHVDMFDTIVHGFGASMRLNDTTHTPVVTVTTHSVAYAQPVVADAGVTVTDSNYLGDPDPQFTAPGSDYTLKATSPLIDRDPAALSIFEASTDLAGNARLINGKRDIGAYERPDPTAVTDAATAITQTAAALSGSANEGGAAGGGSAQLVYGTTAAYGQTLASQALPLSAAPVAITGALTGLTPATTYHYALKVQTPLGTVTSADATFTTAAVVPEGGGGTNPPGGGGTTDPKPTVAVIRSLSFSPSSFRAARSGATLAAAKKKPTGGATLSISLSAAASVTFTVTRQDAGVKSGKRCLARGHGRHGKPCTLAVRIGTATSKALKSGTTKLRFTGRVSSKALKAAKYVLSATPRGGKPRTAKFTIKR